MEEKETERFHESQATFSSVHTEAREQTRANTRRRSSSRRNGSSSVRRQQHGNKLYCGNALDRIRCTPIRVEKGGGRGLKERGGATAVPELNKPDRVHSGS